MDFNRITLGAFKIKYENFIKNFIKIFIRNKTEIKHLHRNSLTAVPIAVVELNLLLDVQQILVFDGEY